MPIWILDVILGVFLLVMLVIGYKCGFLRVVLKIASSIGGIIVALLFTEPLAAKLVEAGVFNSLADKIVNNIKATEAYQQYVTAADTFDTQALMAKLGIPEFLEKFFVDAFAAAEGALNVDIDAALANVSSSIINVVATVVAFIALLIVAAIGFWAVKLVVKKLRDTIKLIKFVDGILGVALYALLGVIVVFGFLLISSLIMQSNTNGFTEFMCTQLHLEDDKFGLAKWLYQNNYLGKFISLFL